MLLMDIVIFLAVLGVMIVFHELGHFLAAKACGIYVDRFMIGMPPRIFGIKWGETDYALGAMPFGGYVKMAGQEDAPLSEEERTSTYGHVPPERWFNNKPIWQRFIVIAAGPVMNLILAILLYGLQAAIGWQVQKVEVDNRIGHVSEKGPAMSAPLYRMPENGVLPDIKGKQPDATGWRTGDAIITIDGQEVHNISDIAVDAILGKGRVLDVVIERLDLATNKAVRYYSPLEPKVFESDGHSRFGVGPFNSALVDELLENTPAKASGLQKGDIIVRLNGELVDRDTFFQAVEKSPEGQPLNLEVKRGEALLPFTITPTRIGRFVGLFAGAPNATDAPDKTKPIVFDVSAELEAKTPLKRNDIIEKIDGKEATVSLKEEIEHARIGQNVQIEVLRPAVWGGLLRKEQRLNFELPVTAVSAIGVRFGSEMVLYHVPASQVIPEAFNLTYRAVTRTLRTFQMLISGEVSTKELGGPMMIYQVTTAAARAGEMMLLQITAFISVNLFIFNLLPLPVLDGSLLVYLVLEGIRRKPLNVHILERIQQVGVFLLIALMVYVTYNDIMRWISSL